MIRVRIEVWQCALQVETTNGSKILLRASQARCSNDDAPNDAQIQNC